MNISTNQLLWHCRRGTRELDALLKPYAAAKLADMTCTEKTNFGQLLEQQDSDLLDWFFGNRKPDDPNLDQMIQEILQFIGRS
ncbi:MAG: succinate dehydrogenase assembly factor 2 family protein [Acidiferrobacteraceae bacterium]|nr:succinate dehydrogenase assembly factor 2 family protein [Acidiferrobacteraceae bacterium]|tara:strand:+ start:998 stop:1246 length:249 start_codon:yes stop_codon:yes gene_type:complete